MIAVLFLSRPPIDNLWELAESRVPRAEEVRDSHEAIEQLAVPTEEGKKLLKALRTHHLALKEVDASWSDRQAIEEEKEVQVKYTQAATLAAAAVRRGERTTEIDDIVKKMDSIFAQTFLATDTLKARIEALRQDFLDSIEKSWQHLEAKGMRTSWKVDSTPLTAQLERATQVISNLCVPGTPQQIVAFHEKERDLLSVQVSHRHLKLALQQVQRIKCSCASCPLTEIQKTAIKCLHAFTTLRQALDNKEIQTIEEPTVLYPLIDFADTFRKMKMLEMQEYITNLERVGS